MANGLSATKDLFGRVRAYISDVRAEMKRVTWPGKQEVYSTTVLVIITTFFFGFYFFVCDAVFRPLLLHIMDWGKSL